MDALLEALAEDPGVIVGAIAVVGMILIGLPAVMMGIAANISNTKERERSRREIAAYVAEGSMSPDDAERLLKAAQPAELRRKCG